ncbi:hypothetical protein DPM33_02955 [Mesorhizobium hawassense]|uniref:Uncharacterized protein n=1 Tax=Mesorhizobium hawassense TaxID=1209954 RepID=A0A330HYS0_9HYPH|nr:hypothetical protein [Mesorhizobium hawassense]RAZ92842.1 hypothetical protein DPM33_02955 [Mesorhizobium hawassense]
MRALAAILLWTFASAAAQADSIVQRAYTWQQLDQLWSRTLAAASPDPTRFSLLGAGASAPAPSRDVPPSDLGVPFAGDVVGESANPQGATSVHAFPVIPLSADDASVLMRRLAWAEIYLGRYRYFAPVSTDAADTLTTLSARQYAAALEAYLITARLYFSADDLPGKCVRLTRLNEIAKGPMSGATADALPEPWRPLLPIAQATRDKLGTDVLAKLVCSVQPVRGRADTVKLVETRVQEKIITAVRAKVDETLGLMNAKATEFQTLVNNMNVPIKSAEVIELERVLGNAQANMVLVKEDQLKAAATIAALSAVDLSTLNQPTSLQEFQNGKTKLATVVDQINSVMTTMATLAQVSNDPALSAQLAPCAALQGAYSALDLSRDTGALTAQIDGPYEACINQARTVVAQFQQPSLEKTQMAALAKFVRQISEAYLLTVQP